MTAKPGIGTVAYNQICLTLFQKLCTTDGGTVCDFDTDIRVGLMEFLQIINEKIPADRIAGSNTQLAFQQIVSGQERFSLIQKLELWMPEKKENRYASLQTRSKEKDLHVQKTRQDGIIRLQVLNRWNS